MKQIPALQVDIADFYPIDNAQEHKTDRYEIIRDSPPSPVFRRGQLFYMAVRFDHPFDHNQDIIRLVFDFGKLILFWILKKCSCLRCKINPICEDFITVSLL